MSKAQFIEILSRYLAPALVERLAEQADEQGYFDETKKICFDGKINMADKEFFDNSKILKAIRQSVLNDHLVVPDTLE